MRTTTAVLLDYTGEQLDDFIKGNIPNRLVIQILPTSPLYQNERTGLYHCDYLLLYTGDK
jgi:hypothetical protein